MDGRSIIAGPVDIIRICSTTYALDAGQMHFALTKAARKTTQDVECIAFAYVHVQHTNQPPRYIPLLPPLSNKSIRTK